LRFAVCFLAAALRDAKTAHHRLQGIRKHRASRKKIFRWLPVRR
jgi:hypothetical protein